MGRQEETKFSKVPRSLVNGIWYILYNFPRNIQQPTKGLTCFFPRKIHQPTRTHHKWYSILGHLRIFYASIASSLFRGFYTATNLILSQYTFFLIIASFRFFKYLIPSTFDTPSSQNPTNNFHDITSLYFRPFLVNSHEIFHLKWSSQDTIAKNAWSHHYRSEIIEGGQLPSHVWVSEELAVLSRVLEPVRLLGVGHVNKIPLRKSFHQKTAKEFWAPKKKTSRINHIKCSLK